MNIINNINKADGAHKHCMQHKRLQQTHIMLQGVYAIGGGRTDLLGNVKSSLSEREHESACLF